MKDIPRGVVNPVSAMIAAKEHLNIIKGLLYDTVEAMDYRLEDVAELKITALMASTLYSLEAVDRLLEELNGQT